MICQGREGGRGSAKGGSAKKDRAATPSISGPHLLAYIRDVCARDVARELAEKLKRRAYRLWLGEGELMIQALVQKAISLRVANQGDCLSWKNMSSARRSPSEGPCNKDFYRIDVFCRHESGASSC